MILLERYKISLPGAALKLGRPTCGSLTTTSADVPGSIVWSATPENCPCGLPSAIRVMVVALSEPPVVRECCGLFRHYGGNFSTMVVDANAFPFPSRARTVHS